MSYIDLKLLIDGEWIGADQRETLAVTNPATDEVLGQLPLATPADLDRALQASQSGFEIWRNVSAFDRQELMNKAADLMTERKQRIAEICTREMGKPYKEALGEMDFVIGVTRWYGEEGKRAYGRLIPSRMLGAQQMVVKEPVGPVAAFVAWNFPGTNVIRKIAGALGAGCSIILKASEETPGTCIALAECFQEAGLPKGVLNLVFGEPADVSAHLLASPIPRKVSFTGSVAVGKTLQKLSADTLKRTTMELGGHAPVLVFEDANVVRAAKIMAAFKFRNAGQVCVSPTRFYIHKKVYDQFIDVFQEKVSKLAVGDGMAEGTQMGPLIAARRLDVMADLVQDACARGAQIVCGGERLGNVGHFYAPTILRDVPETARIMQEEPFGPLAPIAAFEDEADIIARANQLPVGLAAYAFTSDAARLNRLSDQLNVGLLGLNHPAISLPETPFGGVNESGYGSEGGIEGLEAYQRTKFITHISEN